MSTPYTVILALYSLNWLLSLWAFGRTVNYGYLGWWVLFSSTTSWLALRSIEGEIIGWKHNVLAGMWVWVAVSAVICIFLQPREQMKSGTVILAAVLAPLFLWMLFTG